MLGAICIPISFQLHVNHSRPFINPKSNYAVSFSRLIHITNRLLMIRFNMAQVRATTNVLRSLRQIRQHTQQLHLSNSRADLSSLSTLPAFSLVSTEEFREKVFVPEIPTLLTPRNPSNEMSTISDTYKALPAMTKWFRYQEADCRYSDLKTHWQLDYEYLSKYEDVDLPYEFVFHTNNMLNIPRVPPSTPFTMFPAPRLAALDPFDRHKQLIGIFDHEFKAEALAISRQGSEDPTDYIVFRRFQYPLSLFLDTSKVESSRRIPSLYIAQAQMADLPKELQEDLPTPELVKTAGRGDVYDSNIWMGLPPTYTPLHKDPNPNLFIQLSGAKAVRIFKPDVGKSIFSQVQREIGQNASAQFRGEEMMEGMERKVLEEVIWGDNSASNGFEAVVHPGDAVFIPKGWWHSFKSIGDDVSMSANWVCVINCLVKLCSITPCKNDGGKLILRIVVSMINNLPKCSVYRSLFYKLW